MSIIHFHRQDGVIVHNVVIKHAGCAISLLHLNFSVWLAQYFCNTDHFDVSICETVTKTNPRQKKNLHRLLKSNNQKIFIHAEELNLPKPSHMTHTHSFVSNCCLPWGWHPTWELNPVNTHYLSFPLTIVCSLLLHSFSESPLPYTAPPALGGVLTPGRAAAVVKRGRVQAHLKRKDKTMLLLGLRDEGETEWSLPVVSYDFAATGWLELYR